MNGIQFSRTIFLLGLAATAIAQRAQPPAAKEDTLEEVVVRSEQERERQPSSTVNLRNPDVITVARSGGTTVLMLLHTKQFEKQLEIRFRRTSAARMAAKILNPPNLTAELTPDRLRVVAHPRFLATSIELATELATGVDEDDGKPAVIPFNRHSSLVNIEYLRLKENNNPTAIKVRNVIDPQTRRCEDQGGWVEDEQPFSNRFLLVSDSLRDCRNALQSRLGDLLLADAVPEMLQRDLFEIYEPIAARFSSRLGSEPGLIYVVWRPESSRSDMRFEASWNRSVLLLFNGARWQQGIPLDQRGQLRDLFIRDQIERRIREVDQPGMFTASAVSYLVLLAGSEYEKTTNRRLAQELPSWIAKCADSLDGRKFRANTTPDVPGNECGRLLQFVYDAVARAGAGGGKTVYDTWRQLLRNSGLRRNGVPAQVFMRSSSDAERITRGLLQGSMDWPKFAEELGRFGVQLRIKLDQPGVTAEVLSLAYFQ